MEETYRYSIWGSLAITEEGDIINYKTKRVLKVYTLKGNPTFHHPDLKTGVRLDYAMAMLFLNNGVLIDDIHSYYVLHKDGDPENCSLDNLELITDKKEVFKRRFSHLKKKRNTETRGISVSEYEPPIKYVFIGDTFTLEIEELTVLDACKKFNIGKSYLLNRAVKGTYLFSDTIRYVVGTSYLDAYELL